MTPGHVVVVLAASAVPALVVGTFVRRAGRPALSRRILALVAAAAAALGFVAEFAQRLFTSFAGFSLEVGAEGAAVSVIFAFALVAPLEEGAKALVVLPMLRTGHLSGRLTGVLFAVAAAGGFATADTAAYLATGELSVLRVGRALLAVPMQFFCAGLWGYALGDKVRRGASWFGFAWLGAVVVHGLYDHIVFGRGPGVLSLVVPMLVTMGLLSWMALREVAPSTIPSVPSRYLPPLPEPPSLRDLRRALKRSEHPLMLHWILFGALVNVGVVLALLALAVYVGHLLKIDFAAVADEADMRSNGPLVLLGSALMLAFPFAGYLVARASGTTSVLEPGMATALSIASVVAVLSLTAPIAVLFALAIAPVAFGLSCGGAWVGIKG